MSTFHLPLHVETRGVPPGPDVPTFLLLHGFGGSSFTWRGWAPALGEIGHVVQVDLKGFGAAPRPDDGAYGPKDQADLIKSLIRQRDLHRITLVGHSLGGSIALITALDLIREDPSRLERLIVVAGPAYRQKLAPFVALGRVPRFSNAVIRLLGTRRIVRYVLRSIVFDPKAVSAGQVEGYAHPLDSAEARRALWDSARAIVPPKLDDYIACYPTLDVPALLLWGRRDPVVPLWVGERLAAELPRAQLEVMEQCGHAPPEEHPAASLKIVLDFLARTSRPGPLA